MGHFLKNDLMISNFCVRVCLSINRYPKYLNQLHDCNIKCQVPIRVFYQKMSEILEARKEAPVATKAPEPFIILIFMFQQVVL